MYAGLLMSNFLHLKVLFDKKNHEALLFLKYIYI